MRVTVLSYLEDPNGPPDVVVEQVAAALREKGHTVSTLAVKDDLNRLVTGVRRRKPDLIFNLMEMFGEDLTADVAVAGLLELLGVAYTGSGPGELYVAQDKVLGKHLLAFERLPFPRFA